jgi:hypothetical protein
VLDGKGRVAGVAVPGFAAGSKGFVVPARDAVELVRGRLHRAHFWAPKEGKDRADIHVEIDVVNHTETIKAVKLTYLGGAAGRQSPERKPLVVHPDAKAAVLTVADGLAVGDVSVPLSQDGKIYLAYQAELLDAAGKVLTTTLGLTQVLRRTTAPLDDDLKRVLRLLNGTTEAEKMQGIGLLMTRAEKRSYEEINAALVSLVVGLNDFNKHKAVEALAYYGTADCVLFFAATVKENGPWTAGAACKALGQWRDERGIDALLGALGNILINGEAAAALCRFGPRVEKRVIPLLESDDLFVQGQACRILEEIGTSVSIPALTKAAASRDRVFADGAARALKAVRARSAAEKSGESGR